MGIMIPSEDMTPDSLERVRQLAKEAYAQIDHIYLHWTAGHYGQCYDSYHICIDEGGEIYIMCDDFTEYKSHTWKRNSEAIGIALCCCVGAEANSGFNADLGDEPPTMEQIESMARVVAVLAKELELPLYNSNYVMTHCEAAYKDGYGPFQSDPDMRWDLWYIPDYCGDGKLYDGGGLIRGKAAWYQRKWEDEIYMGD
jgi:hypothetical protein